LPQVASRAKAVLDRGERAPVLIFDDATGQLIEVDFRGTAEEVAARVGAAPTNGLEAPLDNVAKEEKDTPEGTSQRGPGRPKLGVVGREVTLLPRHWEWLNRQPGGASVALRKLVEEARRVHQGRDRVRQAQEAAYRFLSAMAGNEPGFEEAARALFAGNRDRFHERIEAWPVDLRDHSRKLAAAAFGD
jgi:hypothetical protein